MAEVARALLQHTVPTTGAGAAQATFQYTLLLPELPLHAECLRMLMLQLHEATRRDMAEQQA